MASDQTVQTADRELRDAESKVAELEQAVVNGDADVTYAAIEKAKSRVGFLTLQRRGAEKRAAERETAERQAALDEALAQREQFYAEGTTAAQQAYAGLIDALRTFTTELADMRDDYSRIGERANLLGVEVPQDARWVFEFSNYHDVNGEAFIQAAQKEAAGQLLHNSHGLHSAETRAEYQARADEAVRFEEERQARYMAQFTTRPEYTATA